MEEWKAIPEHFAIAIHPQMPAAEVLAQEIAEHLIQRGKTALYGSLYDEALREKVKQGAFDVLIALGGDGTMLRSGHLCAPSNLPILGINLGRLGFLIEIERDEWQAAMDRLLDGGCWLENRMMLQAEHRREANILGRWDVLNECVVGRGAVMRSVRIRADIDGRHMTTYVADALIAATATGSTAYALAAGGPIMPPELRNILLVPVAPHLSVDRAVILHEGSNVLITIRTDHDAILSVDGQPAVHMKDGDQVHVRAGSHAAKFVRFQEPDYFYRNLTSRMQKNPILGEAE
jgi:NAD+ kinase